ncbi:MAG: glycosyltransferase family 9 protein [Pirellulaceae bacterium]
MDAPQRILITRLSHIGDCLLTLPLVVELKRQFPDCEIVWACERAGAQLIQHHPCVDEVLVVTRKWLHTLQGIRYWRSELRRRKIDTAMDPQGLLKSSLLGFISGARTRIGFKGEHGREGSRWLNNHLVQPRREHLVDRTLELLAKLPLPREIAEPSMDLPLPEHATAEIHAFLDEFAGRPYAIINPGASWRSKQWESRRFGQVAKSLFEDHGIIPLATWAGPEESVMADEIVTASCGVARKAPETSLPELGALIKHARFFLGCDTGPLHLAVAMGTRCIGLYGPTLPTHSGAYGSQNIAIQHSFQDGSRTERRSASNDAMMQISVNDVLQAIEDLLANQQTNRHGRSQPAA